MKRDQTEQPADILLVSNGFGEAAIATYIAKAIVEQAEDAVVEHFPLVGCAPQGAWPPCVGPQQAMPSGGLVTYWNVKNLGADLRAGLGSLTLRQVRFLKTQRRRDVIIAVGDIYCLALCLFIARRSTLFVATAKSNYVAPHSALERAIARRAVTVFARDALTAEALCAAGVRARYVGNVMMDGLQRTNVNLRASGNAAHFGILPGSRADAAGNAKASAERLIAIAGIEAARGREVQAFFSLAPGVDAASMHAQIRAAGIALSHLNSGDGVIASGQRGNLSVALVRGAFRDLLDASDLVLGQAGTANEQAAGLGRPVVAAAQPGEAPDRMHWYRMRQKRLLGDALLVLPSQPEQFAAGVVRLLDDPERMRRMAEVGRERMGKAGAAAVVASAALAIAQSKRS